MSFPWWKNQTKEEKAFTRMRQNQRKAHIRELVGHVKKGEILTRSEWWYIPLSTKLWLKRKGYITEPEEVINEVLEKVWSQSLFEHKMRLDDGL